MYSSYQAWMPGSYVDGYDSAEPDAASLPASATCVHGPFGSPFADL
jgi:hypothetical protein